MLKIHFSKEEIQWPINAWEKKGVEYTISQGEMQIKTALRSQSL